MAENPGIHVLTDARWAELEPLIDEVRPPCKVPHDNLRETIAAILWRHQNGAKRRAIPGELGPWWKAAQTFVRWAHLGVWERLFDLVQRRGVAASLSGTPRASGTIRLLRTTSDANQTNGTRGSRSAPGGFC